ncbi:unnamed protein product [Cylicocyclus nassatus]|uniref:C-type lectin domain-containing protein n=1 Tax=Cylicocyclus nassatus TaxID=53992 RepID=A0AA36H003_CYLNA|nr:unnamed protein product [Cylicocyclus nassatus]
MIRSFSTTKNKDIMMMKAAVLMTFILVSEASTCEKFVKFGDVCYMKSCYELTFERAEMACIEDDAFLTTIENEQEFLRVAGLVKGDKKMQVWIGLAKKEREWQWVNGLTLDKKEFTAERLAKWEKRGNCAYLRTSPNGRKKLGGANCNRTSFYICKSLYCS